MSKTYNYPHSISNKHGETLHFVSREKTDKGEILRVANKVTPGSGPVMHTHLRQEEKITVVKGQMGIQVMGQPAKTLGVGESVLFEKGVPHRFWNSGNTDLECEGYISPPDNIEYFLEKIYASMDENGGRPGAFDGAYLSMKYKSEFDLPEVPGFVKKVIFPITVFLGKLAGKHKKFADAPAAVGV